MPRYFFHVIDGKEMLDTVGTVLAGEAEARAEAIVVSGEMLKDLGGTFWNHGEWQVRVVDEAGAAFINGASPCRCSTIHASRSGQVTRAGGGWPRS